jgi:hypothetical protein
MCIKIVRINRQRSKFSTRTQTFYHIDANPPSARMQTLCPGERAASAWTEFHVRADGLCPCRQSLASMRTDFYRS